MPGGYGVHGTEGKILAAQYAREHNIPFLGLCLGMQMAVVEYARNVAGMKDANSTEFYSDLKYPVIILLDKDFKPIARVDKKYDHNHSSDSCSPKDGTLRLGTYDCVLKDGSKAKSLYKQDVIHERHRHSYEVNPDYLTQLEKDCNFVVSGISPNGKMVELIVDIAKFLKVPSVAEGVETETQLQALKKMGCDVIQGYYFSKPMSLNEFESFVKK